MLHLATFNKLVICCDSAKLIAAEVEDVTAEGVDSFVELTSDDEEVTAIAAILSFSFMLFMRYMLVGKSSSAKRLLWLIIGFIEYMLNCCVLKT